MQLVHLVTTLTIIETPSIGKNVCMSTENTVKTVVVRITRDAMVSNNSMVLRGIDLNRTPMIVFYILANNCKTMPKDLLVVTCATAHLKM